MCIGGVVFVTVRVSPSMNPPTTTMDCLRKSTWIFLAVANQSTISGSMNITFHLLDHRMNSQKILQSSSHNGVVLLYHAQRGFMSSGISSCWLVFETSFSDPHPRYCIKTPIDEKSPLPSVDKIIQLCANCKGIAKLSLKNVS